MEPVDSPVVTSPYGERIDPISFKRSFHDGIDFVCGKDAKGTGAPALRKVYAVTDGIIIADYDNYDERDRWIIGKPDSGGNWCVQQIDFYGQKLYLYYIHLVENYVSLYQKIKAGTLMGIYGNVGYSTGAHLHFGVKDENWKPFDANLIMKECQ
jgi:murein DD-endopeptidase MepM/ murein hydrolase activator NlpD